MRRRTRSGAALAAALAPATLIATLFAAAPAPAGVPITKPIYEAHRDSLGPDGRPVPGVAVSRSASTTFTGIGAGGVMLLLGGAAGSVHVMLIGGTFTAAGIVLGPAAGYRYGDVPGGGMRGAGLRTVLLAGPPLVAAMTVPQGFNEDERRKRIGTSALVGVGLALAAGVWDIEHVEGAVRRRNAEVAAARAALEPCTTPFSGAPGLAVRVRFGPGRD